MTGSKRHFGELEGFWSQAYTMHVGNFWSDGMLENLIMKGLPNWDSCLRHRECKLVGVGVWDFNHVKSENISEESQRRGQGK